MPDDIIAELFNTSLIEWLAVSFGVLYVFLAAYKLRLCWIAAMISTALFTFLCLKALLYIEASLQVFYFIMAIYGWWLWTKDQDKKLPIRRWPWRYHVWNVLLSSGIALLLGYFTDNYTDQANPYLDAFTTVFSLLATFMVAKRILENWLYWVAIDTGLIFLYGSKGYVLTAIQYGFFAVIALFAWWKWYSFYKSQRII